MLYVRQRGSFRTLLIWQWVSHLYGVDFSMVNHLDGVSPAMINYSDGVRLFIPLIVARLLYIAHQEKAIFFVYV